MSKSWLYKDDIKFINKIINENIKDYSLLIIDAGTLVPGYYQDIDSGAFFLTYEVYDKNDNLLYKTPEYITYNNRYLNKGYLTLSQKYKNNISKNGCYIVDTAQNLNKIRKIKFSLSASTDKEKAIYFIFNIKPNYKENQINEIRFRLVLHAQENKKETELLFEVDTPIKNSIAMSTIRIENGIFGDYVNNEFITNDENKTVEFVYQCDFEAFNIQ